MVRIAVLLYLKKKSSMASNIKSLNFPKRKKKKNLANRKIKWGKPPAPIS